MILLPESREWAHRLLARDAVGGDGSEPIECVALRVYEKLRRRLSALAGVAGFQSLASRALTMARSESPDLSAVKVAANGCLQGLGEPNSRIGNERSKAGEGEVVLIARLLGLLLVFLGEALTLNLISDLWPDEALDERNSENGRKA